MAAGTSVCVRLDCKPNRARCANHKQKDSHAAAGTSRRHQSKVATKEAHWRGLTGQLLTRASSSLRQP
jgi:hypothetical protein